MKSNYVLENFCTVLGAFWKIMKEIEEPENWNNVFGCEGRADQSEIGRVEGSSRRQEEPTLFTEHDVRVGGVVMMQWAHIVRGGSVM